MQTVEELRLLHSITRSIVESKDFDSALEISLRKICESTGWTYGEVWILSEDKTHLEYSKVCYSNLEEMERFRIESEGFKFSPGVGLPGRVWSSKKSEWIDDVTINGKFPRKQLAMNSGLKSSVGIPVITDSDVIAVMVFLTSEILEEDEKTIEFISNVASQLGVFINHKKIKHSLYVRERQQAIISRLGLQALSRIDLSEFMNEFVNILAEALEVEYCKILELLPDGNSLLLRAGVGWKEGLVGYAKVGAGIDSQAGYTILSDSPIIVDDLRTETRFSGPPLLHEHKVISGMSVIIGGRDKPYGVLGVHTIKHQIFTEDDINFLQAAANILGQLNENKKLEEESLKTQKLEAIGILAGGIAHDFNNLLTAIIGNIQLSKIRLKCDDKIFNWLTISEKACGQAKELSNRLITFARGGTPIRDTISISELIKEALSELLNGSNIICKYNFQNDIHPVKIDKTQIKQVIKNIVINAKEAMSEDGIIKIDANNITITRDNLPLKEGTYVKITITDNGKGIPQEIQPKIFDPYFTTKEMGTEKGRGLGLSISYSIIKQHDGLIAVDSKVGAGTSIKIYLPTN